MVYAIGRKSNTRGRSRSYTVHCLLCAGSIRVMNADVYYGVCRACRGPRSGSLARLNDLLPLAQARYAEVVGEERERVAATTENPCTVARVAHDAAMRRAWSEVVQAHSTGVPA